MGESIPYYDWNTGKSLDPWEWLWDDDDEEEWELSAERGGRRGEDFQYSLMTIDTYTYTPRRKKSIEISSREISSDRYVNKTVDNSVDKLCKNRKIIINKNR